MSLKAQAKQISSHLKHVIGVYAFVNKINYKVYIGSSKDVSKRCEIHVYNLIRDAHIYSTGERTKLQKDWNIYSADNFTITCIQECASCSEALLMEQLWFYFYQINNLWKNYTYNINKTAHGGLGEEAIEKMLKKMRAPAFRKKHSLIMKEVNNRPEVKVKNSMAQKELYKNKDYVLRKSKVMKEAMNRYDVVEQRKKINADPIHREKHRIATKIALNKPETLQKLSIASSGDNNGRAKTNEKQVYEIRKYTKQYVNTKHNMKMIILDCLSNIYGLPSLYIRSILYGGWNCVGFPIEQIRLSDEKK